MSGHTDIMSGHDRPRRTERHAARLLGVCFRAPGACKMTGFRRSGRAAPTSVCCRVFSAPLHTVVASKDVPELDAHDSGAQCIPAVVLHAASASSARNHPLCPRPCLRQCPRRRIPGNDAAGSMRSHMHPCQPPHGMPWAVPNTPCNLAHYPLASPSLGTRGRAKTDPRCTRCTAPA